MSASSSHEANLRPHALARELATGLRPGASILEIGAGRGRNTRYLRGEGYAVRAVPDGSELGYRADGSLYDGALSTHGLLHGMPAAIGEALGQIAASLKPGAPLYATFGSCDDPRFGSGTRLGAHTFAPADGEEAGVPHSFFDEADVRALMRRFTVASIEKHPAEHIAGSVHWFVRANAR